MSVILIDVLTNTIKLANINVPSNVKRINASGRLYDIDRQIPEVISYTNVTVQSIKDEQNAEPDKPVKKSKKPRKKPKKDNETCYNIIFYKTSNKEYWQSIKGSLCTSFSASELGLNSDNICNIDTRIEEQLTSYDVVSKMRGLTSKLSMSVYILKSGFTNEELDRISNAFIDRFKVTIFDQSFEIS